MTARTLATVLTLAAVALTIGACLPPAPRVVFGLFVLAADAVYLAAGFLPRLPGPPVVIVGVRAGSVARCWSWPAPIQGRQAW